MNFEEKKQHNKEVTENSDVSSKSLKSESKKINYDAIKTWWKFEKSQTELKKVRRDRRRTLSIYMRS